MNVEKVIAGVAVAAGSLMLIWKGEVSAGVGLLGALVGFFVGETNGKKIASKEVVA